MRYETIRKYIGPLELIILVVGLAILAYYLDKREKTKELEELASQIEQAEKELAPVYDMPVVDTSFKRNAENPHFKVLDSIYSPFMVDSLCRFTEKNASKGFLTMTKNAPYYKELCSTEKNYFMWVNLDKYFPSGELLKITGIAENDELIQFHFTREQDVEAMDDVIQRMDSTLKKLNHPSSP